MWICTNFGLFSVVALDDSSGELVVRARKEKHLEKLLGPKTPIFESGHTDYRFRSYINREKFSELIELEIRRISYTNFKNSVKDSRLFALYADFWSLHKAYQEEEHAKATRKRPASSKFRDRRPTTLS